ncbi:hypothetical protein E3N88_32765 [Mikania micrantha]|uniref:DUF7870 domain-containing protein n=1 Tax=Mikania micrantha TaxID=192012 RepID=A0A5N6M9A9_9ASTR|nr:hypothetical protein E3N88_32765 [Mikania micrantha]
MDFKALKWQMIRGSLARRLILVCLSFMLVVFIVSIAHMAIEIRANEPVLVNLDKCSLDIDLNAYEHAKKPIVGGKNLTVSVIKELMNKEILVRSATPVSLLLRTSEIHHVCGFGSLALIMFKKKMNCVNNFKDYQLPSECPSISRNKLYMQHIEPLVDQNLVSYLPKFVNISSRNKLVYINMGRGELGPDYPIDPTRFNAYVVDHNLSALSYSVKKPGVTFVYHPGLLENNTLAPSVNHGDYDAPLHEKPFKFINWFKETVKDGDFVVLMMNAGVTQLKVLFELFENGVICHVDEMFIRCNEGVDCRNSRCNDCSSLFRGLRNAGVFVHRWLEV